MPLGKPYNGCPSYETWNLQLWIDNEESIYRAAQRLIRTHGPDITAKDVEDFARGWFDPSGTPDFDGPQDWDEVDWEHMADNWNEEYRESYAEAMDDINDGGDDDPAQFAS